MLEGQGEAGGRGTLRSVLAPPSPSTSTSTPVLFGSVGLRGCSLSLFLSDSGAARCVLLHLDPPPALPWESVLRPRKEKQPSAAPCSPLGQCGRSRVSIPVARQSRWFIWVSTRCGSTVVIQARREPWINRGGVASVLPQGRHRVLGRAPSDASSQVAASLNRAGI